MRQLTSIPSNRQSKPQYRTIHSWTHYCQEKDPHPPITNYHELKLYLVTFCALLWVLFRERCNYFDNCYTLLNMLDSNSVFASVTNFTSVICGQITWAIFNDKGSIFSSTDTADHLNSGYMHKLTSSLMQIIGAEVHACHEI